MRVLSTVSDLSGILFAYMNMGWSEIFVERIQIIFEILSDSASDAEHG